MLANPDAGPAYGTLYGPASTGTFPWKDVTQTTAFVRNRKGRDWRLGTGGACVGGFASQALLPF